MDNQKQLTSPIWWTVLATVITGLGSEILANLAMNQHSSSITIVPVISAALFILGGSAFFYRALLAEAVREEVRRKVEEKEHIFLWNIHDSQINPNMLIMAYSNIATKEEIEQWRRNKIVIVPEKIFTQIRQKSAKEVIDQFHLKLRVSSMIGFLFALGGTMLGFVLPIVNQFLSTCEKKL